MGRAKQRMELISNEKTRYLTFQKRKKGLLKKTYELKTLCDVQVCLIIYGPRLDHRPVEPEIWPSSPDDINRLIDSYRKQPSEDRIRKTVDLSNFFQDRKQKIEDDIAKLRKKNEEAKYTKWDDRYDSLSKEELENFENQLESKITELKAKVELMKGSAQAVVPFQYGGGYCDLGQNFCGNAEIPNNVFGQGGGFEGIAANLPPAVMMMNDNFHHHHYGPPSDGPPSNQSYFLHQPQMDRSVGYDPTLMLMDQKNSFAFNNNLAHLGQFNVPDLQQVSAYWHPQLGLHQVYGTNPNQFYRSM